MFTFVNDASENPTFYADITNPQSLNKYQYTYGNPVSMTDGDGHCPICVVVAAAAVVGYILLSPQTVHAPTPTDSYRERSASSAAQIVSLGAAEALGGPIISKIGSKVASKLASRAGASAAEQAALQAQRQQLVRLLHIKELGTDPAVGGVFRAAEGQAGARLEAQLGRRLSRDPTGITDFLRGNTTYDLVGAGLKSKYFNLEGVTDQIVSHLQKADRVVVDVSQLSRAQTASVQQFVNGLAREQASRVIILH